MSKLSQEVQKHSINNLKTKFSNKIKDFELKKKQRELSNFNDNTLEIKIMNDKCNQSVETLIDKDI